MNATTTQFSATEREGMARAAFWGSFDSLSNFILEAKSYESDGLTWKSNGETLAEYIRFVGEMDADDLEAIVVVSGWTAR